MAEGGGFARAFARAAAAGAGGGAGAVLAPRRPRAMTARGVRIRIV